ncbi:hypothetical protein JHK85_010745 [Glycine max]|nr:hypothetical protein JHK85_010745 [Glycine max]
MNPEDRTDLCHLVFGIAVSTKLWDQRKSYIKLRYRVRDMRDIMWLNEKVKSKENNSDVLPPLRIFDDMVMFMYTNRQGHRLTIRISRIVSETLQLGMKDTKRLSIPFKGGFLCNAAAGASTRVTLCKGLNRGFRTLLAGLLAFLVAYIANAYDRA